MNRYILLFLFIIGGYTAVAQCNVSSLVINTGYNPLTGLAIAGSADGGTPVPDPHWIVTGETPSIAVAITSTGLIEVVPGASADIITTLGGWISDPAGTPGSWLSCINSNTYTSDGTGPSGTQYNMTFGRPFRLCTDDSIKLDLYIANDNYMSSMDIDGTTLLAFSQPAIADPANFTAFTHFTQTVFLTAGTHTLHAVVNNYNTSTPSDNPTGMSIYGTVSSSTGVNTLISESATACNTFVCGGICNGLSMPDSLHPCSFTSIVLPATIVGTDSILSMLWTPSTGLSYDTILDPTLTTGTISRYYTLTLQSIIPNNLVANGDFGAGNTGFTSSYTYAPGPSSILIEGDYSVYTDPFSVHSGFTSFGDHTTGTGNMLILNGGSTPSDVWCETVPVTPNTNYDFSAWIANCSSVTVGADVPIMQFKINGVLIGSPTTISAAPGTWVNFFNTWNSGVSTTASICIYDANTAAAGNDFVLDDISFEQICVTKDSIYVDIHQTDTTTTRKDTTLCISFAPITLTATAGYASYLWNTGSGATSISAGASGTYWVYNNNTCVTRIDSFGVHYIPLPVVSLGNDTAFCIGNTLTLSSVQPSGYTYLWSDASTGDSIHVSTSGTYWLQVYNGCTVADSIHITISPFPVVDLGPDIFNCLAEPVTLSSSVSYTSPAYLWNDLSTGPSLTVATSGSYWLQVTVAGCPAADSINVTILYDTFTLHNNDTAICRGNYVQALLTANPAATFQWLPTAGIAASTTSSPLIGPDTSAMYYVNIYLTGCPVITDSFYIDVQPNPVVYIGNNRALCAGDSVHLIASVNPQWYTHYSFAWSPTVSLDDPTAPYVVFTAGDSTLIKLVVSTPAGCKSADSALMIVHPGNFARLDSVFNICPHDSIHLMPSGGVSYHWSPGIYLSDSLSADPWLKAITNQAYRIIVTNEYGCTDTLTASVTVRPNAVIYLGVSPVTLYPGQSYQISPQTNCTYFTWFPPAGLNDAHLSDPVATPMISTRYTVDASNEWGCKVTDSIDINLDGSSLLTIPNAFTPGSGVNNKLSLINRGISSLTYFRIFNRWGNKVFETMDINEGWDGTFKGTPQPYDVYVYEIEAIDHNGSTFEKQGNITLIR